MKYLFGSLFALLFCSLLTAQSPVTFSVSDVVADNGQTFEMEVKTNDFTNLTTFQFSIIWNNAILQLDTITAYNSALALTASNFNFTQSGQGKMGLYWFSVDAKTLPAETVLFKLRFEAVAIGVSTVVFADEPTEIHAENTTDVVPVTPINGSVIVQAPMAVNDLCPGAVSIQSLFGKGAGNPQTSTIFDNTNATTNATEPTTGHSCFFDETDLVSGLDNSLWFKFTGDGHHYRITTVQCSADSNYISNGDAQIAVYKGGCGSLTPVDCNEDIDANAENYAAQIDDLGAEKLQDYFILIDGCHCVGNDAALATGQFCLQVEQLTTVGNQELTSRSALRLYPNPAPDRADLQFELSENQEISVDLTDHLGRPVRSVLSTRTLPAGSQNIPVVLDGLPAGLYFLVLHGVDGVETVEFTKM